LSYVRVVTNDELKERKEAAMTDIFLEWLGKYKENLSQGHRNSDRESKLRPPAYETAKWRAQHKQKRPSKESCQNVYKDTQFPKLILNRNMPAELGLETSCTVVKLRA
jgi:hypothetical protein